MDQSIEQKDTEDDGVKKKKKDRRNERNINIHLLGGLEIPTENQPSF